MKTDIYNNNFLLYQENNKHDTIYEGFDVFDEHLSDDTKARRDDASTKMSDKRDAAKNKANDIFTTPTGKSVKQLINEGKNREEILKATESKARNFSRNLPHWPVVAPIASAIDGKYEWYKRAYNPKAWLWNNVNTPLGEEDTMLAGVFKHNKLLRKLGLNNPGSQKSKALGHGMSVMTAIISGIFPIIFIICFMLFLKLILHGDESGMGHMTLKSSTFNLTNIFKLLIFISSYIITFFLLFFTIVTNRIIKGIFLIFGISILLVLTKFLKKIFSVYQDSRIASLYCNILSSPFTVAGSQGIYSVPSTNISVLSFIFFIMTSSMIKNRKEYDFNYPLFLLLLIMIIIVSVTEYFEGCVPKLGIIVAIVVGVTYSFIYQAVLKSIDKHDNDYANIFQMDDDNAICGLDKLSKPGDDGSLIPNENTKYFKCVTKKRANDGSDFIGRIGEDDEEDEEEASNDDGDKWNGTIVLSRRGEHTTLYDNFSNCKIHIVGLEKISNNEDSKPKFSKSYTFDEVGDCNKFINSIDISGYKYYGINFIYQGTMGNSGTEDEIIVDTQDISIADVVWSPSEKITNHMSGNTFDLTNGEDDSTEINDGDLKLWFVVEPKIVEPKIDEENEINVKYSINKIE